jgi:prepilin-type processing-associated H-X9-DG protein
LTNTYYTQDNLDRLAYILGSPGPGGQRNVAPYYQYHQIFNFYKYLTSNLKIYRCPNAREANSVKIYLSPNNPNPFASYYTAFKSDDRCLFAFRMGWFPLIKPGNYPGPRVDPLYTEYWFNDWSSGATSGGKPIPQISGGFLSQIPYPDNAVVMCDAVWETTTPRHGGANQFVFLDAHVEKLAKREYLDPQKARDYDTFGNRPFFAWGLTKEGFNADP